jgi:hypothetical protein
MYKHCKYLIESCVLTLIVSIGLSQQASASVLYSDGPINGTIMGLPIWSNAAAADSFTLSSTSDVTGVDFGAWTQGPGSSMSSVTWAIVPASQITQPTWYNIGNEPTFGTTTTVTSDFVSSFNSGEYTVTSNSFSTGSLLLAAGTYYLVLYDGTAAGASGPIVGWDINLGPSTAYDGPFSGGMGMGNPQSYPYAEAFTIYGDSVTTPLPAALPMFAGGLGFIGLVARRKRKAPAPAA